ncbi:MFS transporter [Novosphingobium humi]|uniref:MFS transporter n=1 Tax=Novosphingobium humi TaxID=2282397 RepID=A0ABY7U1X1_9SPHN|nr:MFS transporter [Novosphingobium humi]WCT79223.1 MFS transporter [Novosphingobium humi]
MNTEPQPVMSPRLISIISVACGLMVSNLYFGQALIGEIAPAIHLSGGAAGLVVTLTQLGYGAGLFFMVSLADIMENRRLVLLMTVGACLGDLGIFFAADPTTFLILSCFTGFCSVGAQVLVPLAAHLAPEESRGRVIGHVMAGLITGIMLARPAANCLAAIAGWRAIYAVSALSMAALAVMLAKTLPERRPTARLRYGELLRSSLSLLIRTPGIRRRTVYQAALFAAFNMFWTAVPLLLTRRFGLGHLGIAIFALAGAGGAFAAPVAGRLGDRGHVRAGTAVALLSCVAAFAVAGWAAASGALVTLAAAAVLLDAATQVNQVLGQRVLYSSHPEARGRINAAYMTALFLSGALSSLLATFSFQYGGWTATACAGAAAGIGAFLFFLTERRESDQAG